MTPRKREELINALKRKGFVQSEKDHVKLHYVNTAGKRTRVWTKVSRGTKYKDIVDPNLSRMARQCKLSNRDFEKLLDCPLSREEYEDMLIAACEIAAVKE